MEKLKILDRISATKVRDISADELKIWIFEELDDLYKDVNQKEDTEQTHHISKRLSFELFDKYKNLEIGKIHAIWQSGITGKYGEPIGKISLSKLLKWINSEQKLGHGENVSQYPDNSEPENDKDYRAIADRCIPFINFCMELGADVSTIEDSEYYRLRNEFNRNGANSVRFEVEKLPKIRNFDMAAKFKF